MTLQVFIAEDNHAVRESLAALLVEATAARIIGTADSEFAATEWLLTHRGQWDLFITDLLLLLGGTGFGLVHRAKSQPAAGTVIVFSDFATGEVADKCRKLGADAVFKKEDLQEFLTFVGQVKKRVR